MIPRTKVSFSLLIPVLAFTLALGIFIVLVLTGSISFGRQEIKENIQAERKRIAQGLEKQMEDIAVEALLFSQTLSRNIENQLAYSGLTMDDLSYHPDILEAIEEHELALILLSLDKAKASGVFVILEATVNPFRGEEYARSGFYIRSTEPVVQRNSYKLYLRGFADLAFKNDLSLQSTWDLELNIKDKEYYTAPTNTFLKNPALPLSRSYFWSFADAVGRAEPALLCSVPMVSSQGTFLGVCGFELSEVNFKLFHSPGTDTYPQLHSMLASLSGDSLNLRKSYHAGGIHPNRKNPDSLSDFVFTDSYELIKLYSDNSPYAEEKMALVLGLPQQDYRRLLVTRNGILAAILLLLGGGILGSYVFLNRYYQSAYAERLIALEAQFAKVPPNFDSFGFSKREKEVCLLLLKGFSIRQIGGQLSIAFDTVNNHCRSIYRKLGIKSRKELFLKFG
ncbi:transcriptional regulator, LuxR family protein [Treponema primitia ZAS-2]|uniref:Transcriptional regulator, LuxR family protein n=1 Tax=Treponema primitia (strain ATCC BAA-887 / DSM 12427 / ZAS-2) TaxID=545694 RepID=F5YI03_TREPZ|nr:helix-turn-helix transcriptional regulator [Treponema primitia]AEF86954.1 transcriptional regulator, LuxR family protein [Treponema primitia ZAS-2]